MFSDQKMMYFIVLLSKLIENSQNSQKTFSAILYLTHQVFPLIFYDKIDKFKRIFMLCEQYVLYTSFLHQISRDMRCIVDFDC